MPHFPKPFFRPSRGLWYVQIRGKQINLGPDQDAAFQRYHDLMRQPKPAAAARAGYGERGRGDRPVSRLVREEPRRTDL